METVLLNMLIKQMKQMIKKKLTWPHKNATALYGDCASLKVLSWHCYTYHRYYECICTVWPQLSNRVELGYKSGFPFLVKGVVLGPVL